MNSIVVEVMVKDKTKNFKIKDVFYISQLGFGEQTFVKRIEGSIHLQ